jgi:hypothetical protein
MSGRWYFNSFAFNKEQKWRIPAALVPSTSAMDVMCEPETSSHAFTTRWSSLSRLVTFEHVTGSWRCPRPRPMCCMSAFGWGSGCASHRLTLHVASLRVRLGLRACASLRVWWCMHGCIHSIVYAGWARGRARRYVFRHKRVRSPCGAYVSTFELERQGNAVACGGGGRDGGGGGALLVCVPQLGCCAIDVPVRRRRLVVASDKPRSAATMVRLSNDGECLHGVRLFRLRHARRGRQVRCCGREHWGNPLEWHGWTCRGRGVCVRVFMRACACFLRVCVRVCVQARVCMCVRMWMWVCGWVRAWVGGFVGGTHFD